MNKRIKWDKLVRSKMLWANMIALIALIAQLEFGFVIAPEEQISAIAVINMILRLVTHEGLIEDVEPRGEDYE